MQTHDEPIRIVSRLPHTGREAVILGGLVNNFNLCRPVWPFSENYTPFRDARKRILMDVFSNSTLVAAIWAGGRTWTLTILITGEANYHCSTSAYGADGSAPNHYFMEADSFVPPYFNSSISWQVSFLFWSWHSFLARLTSHSKLPMELFWRIPVEGCFLLSCDCF